MTPDKIVRNFARCSDWEERYLYLIELGEKLPKYPNSKVNDEYLIAGCQSRVWLDFSYDQASQTFMFSALSDAAIVKGLLALLRVVYHDQTAVDVLNYDIRAWFESIDLKSHLTPGRTQGLDAIIEEIQNTARVAIEVQ
ncbi:SufE family protein [Vibrio gallaecicus]|uniref:SufE family protein n=1 Tax=Vibrio gallaecicus TaxID=552386 RepID=UPI0010C9E820|nr:SufE family protein [Vibrio gallaecicus]MDN3616427.1 SufE family protein [Vibrio gallaecicus]